MLFIDESHFTAKEAFNVMVNSNKDSYLKLINFYRGYKL